MSSQRLATELLEHIVDMLGEGPREECLPALLACSTTNSALLNTSQKHIFHTAVLYSHSVNTTYWFIAPAPDIEARCERTRLFLQTVADNERLSSYVRDVTCRFNDASFCDNDFLHKVVWWLPNIVQFSIDVYNPPNNRNRGVIGVRVNQDALDDIVVLLRRPQLKALRLEPLAGFPLEALRVATGLKTLVLRNCGHSTVDNVLEVPTGGPSLMPKLETLICDRTSLANIVNSGLIQGLSRSSLAQISGLSEVDLAVLSADVSNDISELLLQQVRHLKSFKLTVHESTLSPPLHTSVGRISPLLNLNASSFSTLAHISLNVFTALYPHHSAPREEFTIRDPFLGLCGPPLPSLLALQTLDLNLTVQGNFDFHTYDFGLQWGVLSETLAVPAAYPKLKKVGISIGIRVVCATGSPSAASAINSSDPSTNLLAKYFAYAVKPQFKALECLNSEGVLDFAFKVKVWNGRRFVQTK